MSEKKAFFTNEGAFFVDDKVEENSGNLVTSGAVHDAINGAGGAKEIVYFDIESIDNPPPGLYLSIQTAITNGKIPVIRYDGALYYFDKEYLEDDSPAYSFAGRLDSDEWKTAIRVTSEGVILGNVLGVNGTVANGVRNSFPLGGKCGAESGDPDHPYLEFDSNVYAQYTTFNGNGGLGYVTSGSPVSITRGGVTTTVNPLHSALVVVVGRHAVNPSNMPKGYILVEKNGRTVAAGAVTFYYGQDMPGIVEFGNSYILVLELTMKKTEDFTGVLGNDYTVHCGLWVMTDYTNASNGLANGPTSLATGMGTSTALNNGKAAGPLSLANGNDSLAAGPYSVALYANGIAEQYAMSCGKDAMALHFGSKVLATEGVSGRQFQTVLGRDNELDNESAVVVGWVNKNISKMDTDGNVFTGKRLDLANNIMPLFKLPDSDPASPGTEPVTGYWICNSKKQLVTAAEIVALHAMGMKFVLCENTDPDSNSRMYVEQKCIITNSTIDIEFVSVNNDMMITVTVQKETTAEVTAASLYIASYTYRYTERQWTRQPETVTHPSGTFAAVTNGQLTLGQSHMLARVRLENGAMGGGTTFTVNVQKNANNEVEDNIVYVVNATGSTVTVAVKCDNESHWSHGTVTINAGYGAYVKVNPLYFEVVYDGLVVFD